MARRRQRRTVVPAAPETAAAPAASRNRRLAWPFLIALAGILAYGNSLSGVFTFDDVAGIVENESIRDLWPPTGALAPPSDSEPVAGRPLVNLSFAINYAIDGLEVRGYHLANIALHAGCALLLFGLVRRTVAAVTLAEGASVGADRFAAAAALLWVVHPLTTEAVNYVSQRTELMMALFFLATLYASLRAAVEGGRWPVVAVASCALGMACKETMAVAPLMVMLFDRTLLYRSFGQSLRQRGPFYLALCATWVVLAALIWSGPRWETAGFSAGVSPWTYLLNQSVILVEYLKRTGWPVALVHDYGEPLPRSLAGVAPQAALIVVLLAATAFALVRRPAVGLPAAAFFLLLAPTSSIIPIATEVGAERRMYLPLAAVAILTALGIAALWRTFAPRAAAIGVIATAVILAVPLAAATVDRNADYSNELTLWQSSLERWPQPRAHRNLATLLKREGYREEVIDHLRLALDGAHPEGRYTLGVELLEQGRRAEGIDELRRFIADLPDDPMVPAARQGLADALLGERRFREAAAEYTHVVTARPDFARAWSNLGLALTQGGDAAGGIEAFQRAVTLDPSDATARRNLVAGLLEVEQPLVALPHAEVAVRLDSTDAAGRLMLGVALASAGRLAEAVEEFRAAIERDPSMLEARELLAAIERAQRSSPAR